MVVLIAREPRPDAPYWRGRRLFAAIDAVVWPVVGVLLVLQLSAAGDLLRPAVAIGVLCAAFRLCSAMFINHRYRFTTWLWARLGAVLLLVWIVLKLTLPA